MFWACQYLGNLRVNCGGQRKHVRLLGTQQRRLRYAVNLERGAYDG